MKRRNRQAEAAVAWAAVSLAGVAGAILPFAVGMDGMSGGYAAAFAGGVVAMSGAGVSAISAARARVVARLFADGGALLHWTYPESLRAEQADRGFIESRRRNWALLRVTAAVCTALAFLFVLARPHTRGVVIGVLLAAVVALTAVAAMEPFLERRCRRRQIPEAFVSFEAAYVFGMLHAWAQFGARVEDVGIVPGAVPALRVEYTTPLRLGLQDAVAMIPIPPGEEGRASDVARALAARAEALSARM
ncbi:MAG: hypothetical protein NTX23_05680 [Candidatus Bipolaricaulota bacterium]|nr:hypothetical protein [Candidatus Bipolaricaulota bacterium]